MTIPVTKIWIDGNNQDGLRPKKVTIKLIANGKDTGKFLELSADNKWSDAFEGVDIYASGEKIDYTVEELDSGVYKSVVTGDVVTGFKVTNSFTPVTTLIKGSKTWNDNNNQEGLRPDSITIRLLANGVEVDKKVVTENDNWEWIFTGLPLFEAGKLVNYSITEDAVIGYSSQVDGYDVTNTRTPGETSIQVTKAWKDENDKEGLRPDSVTIKLFANGNDTGKSLTLSADNNWTGTFRGLVEFESGVKVNYTIEEVAVKDYTTIITGNPQLGFIVTNIHDSEDEEVSVPKEETPQKQLPATGEVTGTYSLMGLLLLLAGGFMLPLRKKYEDEF